MVASVTTINLHLHLPTSCSCTGKIRPCWRYCHLPGVFRAAVEEKWLELRI